MLRNLEIWKIIVGFVTAILKSLGSIFSPRSRRSINIKTPGEVYVRIIAGKKGDFDHNLNIEAGRNVKVEHIDFND